MTAYVPAKIARAMLRKIAPKFARVESPVTCYRPDASTRELVDDGSRDAYILRLKDSQVQRDTAGVGIFSADWLVLAALDADITTNDTLVGVDRATSASVAFVVTALPETDQGVLLARCEVTALPEGA